MKINKEALLNMSQNHLQEEMRKGAAIRSNITCGSCGTCEIHVVKSEKDNLWTCFTCGTTRTYVPISLDSSD